MKKQIFVMLTAAALGAAVLSGCSSKGKNAAEKKNCHTDHFRGRQPYGCDKGHRRKI